MSFECTSCGLCCKNIEQTVTNSKQIPWLRPAAMTFPHQAQANGDCEKLVDNRCSVYEDRPLLCNLEQAAKELEMPMSKEQWFDLNYQGCAILQRRKAA